MTRQKAAAEYVYDEIAKDVRRLGQAIGGRTVLAAALDHLALDRRGPNGHDYGVIPAPGSETWCWAHERSIHDCHADNLDCTGESITIADPAGEAALQPDRASTQRAQIGHDLVLIRNALRRMMPVVENSTTATADADTLGIGRDNAEPGCYSCARVKAPSGRGRYWSPIHRTTDCGGTLPQPLGLCLTCTRDVIDLGQLPPKKDVETRRDGGRVRRKDVSDTRSRVIG